MSAAAIVVQGRSFVAPKGARHVLAALGLPPGASFVPRGGPHAGLELTSCDMLTAGEYEVREPGARCGVISVLGRTFRAPKRAREILCVLGVRAGSLRAADGTELIGGDFVSPGSYDLVTVAAPAPSRKEGAAERDSMKGNGASGTVENAVDMVMPLVPLPRRSGSLVCADVVFDAWAERNKPAADEAQKVEQHTEPAVPLPPPEQPKAEQQVAQPHQPVEYLVRLPVPEVAPEAPEEPIHKNGEEPVDEHEWRRRRAEDMRAMLVLDVITELELPSEDGYEQERVRVEMRQPNGTTWVFMAEEENAQPEVIGRLAALMLGVPTEETDPVELIERLYDEGNDFPNTWVYQLLPDNPMAEFPNGIHGPDIQPGPWYAAESRQLFILGVGDDSFDVRVPLGMHVGHAQRVVADRRGLAPGNVQLTLNGKQLVCDRTLEEYGITDKSTLNLCHVGSGGRYVIQMTPPRCIQHWKQADEAALTKNDDGEEVDESIL